MPFDSTPEQFEPVRDPVLDLLLKARSQVDYGWCKGYFQDLRGNVCLVGALGYKSRKLTKTARRVRQKAVNELSIVKWGKKRWFAVFLLSFWNDRKKRTKQDVLNLLDKAIENRRLEAAQHGNVVGDPSTNYIVNAITRSLERV